MPKVVQIPVQIPVVFGPLHLCHPALFWDDTAVVRADMSVFVILSLDPLLLLSVILEWALGASGVTQAALAEVTVGDTLVDGLGVPGKLSGRQVTINLSSI